MFSLAESTKKPYHGPRPPTATSALSQSSLSPNPSPGALRRGPAPGVPPAAPCPPAVRAAHERSASDTPVNSVDLNAESSSVTSLSSFAHLRKSHTSGGSNAYLWLGRKEFLLEFPVESIKKFMICSVHYK